MLPLKNLLRRKIRTVLSIIGVGVGIASIVAFTALGKGFKQGFVDYANQTKAQVFVFQKNVVNPNFGAVAAPSIEKIKAMPEVEATARTLFLDANSGVPGIPSILVFGRDPTERSIEIYRENLEGKLMSAEDEIMVGGYIAERLNIKPGTHWHFLGQDFVVTAIYKTTISWENIGVVVNINVVEKIRKAEHGSASIVYVYTKPGTNAEAFANKIKGEVSAVEAVTADKFLDHFKDQIQYVDTFVWVVSLAALAVGCIGVLNTLLMSVSERTREIGTLRAVGWSRKMILHMIVAEGFMISFLGVLAGIAIGVGGAEALIRLVPRGYLDSYYDWEMVIRSFAVGILIGVAGSIYPAYAATRLTPAEALRYE